MSATARSTTSSTTICASAASCAARTALPKRRCARSGTAPTQNYPPTLYGPNGRLDVEVLSINRIGTNRATVRLRKRLNSINGVQTGLFTATLLFEFRPEARRSIDQVWTNPFGFTVLEYSIRSDRLEN